MSRVLVLCEGQTEQTFFDLVLSEHLAARGVYASCTMICTAREEGRRRHRGGHARRWAYIERDLRLLLRSNPDRVTTLLDVYGFPRDMPGFPAPWPDTAAKRVEALASAMELVIGDPRLIPGLVVHEFEGLLFSGPRAIVETAVAEVDARAGLENTLRAITDAHASPEDIDDGPDTAPSKRLIAAVPGYDKSLHGPLIAQRIGLDTLRTRCPLFGAWLGRLEALG